MAVRIAITLRQLEYFVAVVREGNITRAAGVLNVAQTALGQQIRNLEEELGTALLHRHSRGVTPTDAGEALLEHAQRILHDVAELGRTVRKVSGGGSERLSVGITPSIQHLIGTDLLMPETRRLPGYRLHIVEELSFVLVEALKRGEIDMALAYEVEPAPGLIRRPLMEERLLFITSPERGREGSISFADTLACDLALNGRRDVVWRLVHQTAERLELPFEVAFEVQSVSAIKTLVSRGVGTSVMPYGVVFDELQQGTLMAQVVERPTLMRTLFVVCREDNAHLFADKEVDAFLGDLCSVLELRTEGFAKRMQGVPHVSS